MKKYISVSWMILWFILCIGDVAFAQFFKGQSRGWHWYEDKIEEDEEQPEKLNNTPSEQIQELRKDAERKLHAALMYPTENNVIEYIKAQEMIGDRSEKFSKMWQRVVYKNPLLDRTIKYPVSNNALHIARQNDLVKKREKIKKLSKEYGLMYFFKGDCKYSQEFTTVIESFAQSYNWEVMPIQIGEIGIASLRNVKRNNGIAERLGIHVVPALIAVHPKTGHIVPLAFGYISESEIEDRINILITEESEK